jgi:hypothetical protein
MLKELLDEHNVLRCPVCGYDYNHIVCVYTRMGTDPNEAGVYDGTNAIGSVPDERRSCLVVELRCEQDHKWELRLQQHKGNIEVSGVGITVSQSS